MKKLISLLTSVVTLLSMSTAAFSASGAALEKSDSENYDLYSCNDYYWINDNGEKEHAFVDFYYKFKNHYSGTYEEYSRKYSYVFVTTSNDAACEELDNVLGKHLDIVYYYEMQPNQLVYDYSADFDYEKLYDISGVEKVELAKSLFTGRFAKDVRFADNDTWAEENGIDLYDNNLLMSNVTTEGDVKLTTEMFDNTGFAVKHVFEESSGNWLVYFEYSGMDSYTDFDAAAQNIDGIISSEVSLELEETASESLNLNFTSVSAPKQFGESNDTVSPYDILDVDKDNLKLVISNETSTGRNEVWIDNDYRYMTANLWKTTVAIRMTDGTEPPKPTDVSIVQKLSDVQKLNLLCVESVWFMDADDIKISDDLYVVNGFKTADEAEAYCQKLIADGKADYAEPVVTGKYSYCYPDSTLLDYFKETNINYDESKLDEINLFSDESFIFSVNCMDENATVDYLAANVDGFKECVSAATSNNSCIYFQLKDDANNETKLNVLKQICSLENFSNLAIPTYSELVNLSNISVNALPEKYKVGDVNMDEKVDLYDAVEISKYIMGMVELDEDTVLLADINRDGKTNIYDAIEIAKTLMK